MNRGPPTFRRRSNRFVTKSSREEKTAPLSMWVNARLIQRHSLISTSCPCQLELISPVIILSHTRWTGQPCTSLIPDILWSQLTHALAKSLRKTHLPRWMPGWSSSLEQGYQTGESVQKPNRYLALYPLAGDHRKAGSYPSCLQQEAGDASSSPGFWTKSFHVFWIAHVKLLGFPLRRSSLYWPCNCFYIR